MPQLQKNNLLQNAIGAGRVNRTPMTSQSRDFESRASTNSAIPAIHSGGALLLKT